MMHGNKRHQRRQFQKYQEKYMASKYSGSAATSDDMTIRGYTPVNWTGVKPDGTFTSYRMRIPMCLCCTVLTL